MAEKDSTSYTNYVTNKASPPPFENGGRIIRRRIAHTVVTEASGDTVRVGEIQIGERVSGLALNNDALGASVTLKVSAVDSNASPVTTDLTAATAFAAATDVIDKLAFAGMQFTPATGKATIKLTYGGATPTAGKKIEGYIDIIPAS